VSIITACFASTIPTTLGLLLLELRHFALRVLGDHLLVRQRFDLVGAGDVLAVLALVGHLDRVAVDGIGEALRNFLAVFVLVSGFPFAVLEEFDSSALDVLWAVRALPFAEELNIAWRVC